LGEVREWNDRLANRLGDRGPVLKLLVGTHADDASCPIDQPSIDDLVSKSAPKGSSRTSAMSGRGIDAFKSSLSKLLEWSQVPLVTLSQAFENVRKAIEELQSEKRSTVLYSELESKIREVDGNLFDAQALSSTVSHIARQA